MMVSPGDSSASGHEEREAEVGLVDVRTALAKLSKKGLTKEVKDRLLLLLLMDVFFKIMVTIS